MYLAIMKSTPQRRVAKFQPFATEADAMNHVFDFRTKFPNAFVTLDPNQFQDSPSREWLVHMGNQTLTIQPPAPRVPDWEDPVRVCLRALAETMGHAAKAIVHKHLGPKP